MQHAQRERAPETLSWEQYDRPRLSRRLVRIQHYLIAHIDQPVGIEDAAHAVGASPATVQRLFRATLFVSFAEWLRRCWQHREVDPPQRLSIDPPRRIEVVSEVLGN